MEALRIVVLCIAAAILCSSLRAQRPEIAAAVSLAVGVAALILTGNALSTAVNGARQIAAFFSVDGETTALLFKAAGITIISELGVQICSDAGEAALAGRIRLATRFVMVGMAMPAVQELLDCAQRLLG